MAKRISSLADLQELRKGIQSTTDPSKRRVIVSGGTCGESRGSVKVYQGFIDEMKHQGVEGKADLKYTGCHGFCEREPVVLILPEEICYLGVKPEDVPEIVSETLVQNKVVERLTYEDLVTGERSVKESEIPFYKYQSRIVFGKNRFIDPKSIDDYIAIGGYEGLVKALRDMTPEQVLDEVKKANIRGRGGGGFPAGAKWQTTRDAPGETKYVIVNCDEGDPGAYMDRSLMEGNPHSVLEGLTIGAYAIGAHKGFIYVRQ
ncbi:MAG: NADH-quinone oxidoreductase subunit F, partial [Dehalococcoidia bacterium]